MQQATGGEQRWGGATEVVENLPALDVLPMMTTVTITNAAKISLRAYLHYPRDFFIYSTLGNIMSEFHLVRSHIAWQLLNYKKEKYQHGQVKINLNSSDLWQRICDSLLMSTLEVVSQTLKRICNLQSAYGQISAIIPQP
jgi:hypothetical protein